VGLPAGMELESVTLEIALKLLSLPKTLGKHPDLQKDIKAGIGRFGPYVVCDGDYRSIPKTESIFDIDLKRALEMLSQPKKGRGRAAPLKELGNHPVSGEMIAVMNGPYGPYLKMGKKNISLPEGMTPESVTMEVAIPLFGEQQPASAPKAKKASTAKKTESKSAPTAKSKSAAATKSKASAPTPVAPPKTTTVLRKGTKPPTKHA
jgi:DNA topoisomerase-1